MAKEAATPPSLIEAFSGATQEDLDAIRMRREDLQKEIDALASIERALDVRLNGKAKRKSPEKKTPTASPASATLNSGSLAERRKKVAVYIFANGAKSHQKLSEACGIAKVGPICLSQVVGCDYFHVAPDGIVSLTDKGERFAELP